MLLFNRMNKIIAASNTGEPQDERSRRGDETRRRLIQEGVRLFGARGFDGVTTRDLAAAADCNQAAILYHFGSKEEVYLAVARHVADHVRAELPAGLPHLKAPA